MATKKTGGSGKAAPLDPKIADKLLDKLSNDNEFRRQFKKDPTGALATLGHKLAAGQTVGGCMQMGSIAPKAEIAAARETLKSYLTSAASQSVVFCFEAGKIASSLRRK